MDTKNSSSIGYFLNRALERWTSAAAAGRSPRFLCDRMLGDLFPNGLRRGELTLLAGPGSEHIAVSAAIEAAARGIPTLLASASEGADEISLSLELMAREARIPMRTLETAHRDPNLMAAVIESARRLSALDLEVDASLDESELDELWDVCAALFSSDTGGLVVAESIEDLETCAGLKALAQAFELCVIASTPLRAPAGLSEGYLRVISTEISGDAVRATDFDGSVFEAAVDTSGRVGDFHTVSAIGRPSEHTMAGWHGPDPF